MVIHLILRVDLLKEVADKFLSLRLRNERGTVWLLY
jgi:hypothetical protein